MGLPPSIVLILESICTPIDPCRDADRRPSLLPLISKDWMLVDAGIYLYGIESARFTGENFAQGKVHKDVALKT